MAETPGVPSGPPQTGRGVHGQYVYWITMSHPKPETVQELGLKVRFPPSSLNWDARLQGAFARGGGNAPMGMG